MKLEGGSTKLQSLRGTINEKTKKANELEAQLIMAINEKEEREKRYKVASELLFTGFEHELCMEALEMCNELGQYAITHPL